MAVKARHSGTPRNSRSASTSWPGPQERGRRPAKVTSPVRQPASSASSTAWLPTSTRAAIRTCTNALRPLPRLLPGRPKAAWLASLSATSQQVPSTASTRSPRQNAPGVASVASGFAVVANSTRSGSDPSRCRARNSEDFAGTCQSPSSPRPRNPATRWRITFRYGAGENNASPSTKYTTSRAGRSRLRCSDRPHAATTRSTRPGGYTQVNRPRPDKSDTLAVTRTTPGTHCQPAYAHSKNNGIGPRACPTGW